MSDIIPGCRERTNFIFDFHVFDIDSCFRLRISCFRLRFLYIRLQIQKHSTSSEILFFVFWSTTERHTPLNPRYIIILTMQDVISYFL